MAAAATAHSSLVPLILVAVCVLGISTQDTEPCGGSEPFLFKSPHENLPIGAVAAHVEVHGSDAEVTLIQIGTDPYFAFDPLTRNITVISDLEEATESSPEIHIKCEERGDRTKTADIRYVMTILDLNNHSPKFEDAPYSAEVTELLLPGYVIFDGVKASDGDPSNLYITFEIQPGPYSDHFSFTAPAKGSVQLDKMLDFEEVQLINLTIIAKDQHPARVGIDHVTFTDSAQLLIYVQDGDDQNPEFTQLTYTGRVAENATEGTVVSFNPDVSAYDPDVNVNSPITYSVLEDAHNSDWEYFSIDPSSGHITVGTLSLVRGTVHTFLVQATKLSNENHFTQALVSVTVQATNENAPYFLQSEFKVNNFMENSPVGSSVITVKAMDDDIGSKLVYSLAEVDDFVIDECTGEISTASLLSFEDQSVYTVRVIVSDGTYSDEAMLRVNLFNVNNHNPVFEQREYVFEGKRETGSTLGSVKADDRDTDSRVTYRLASFQSEFHIDPTSGNLTVILENTEGLRDEYVVTVVAEDEGTPPRNALTQVLVTFDPVSGPPVAPPTAGEVLDEGESNLVIVVVLGVLIGVLLVVIAILAFCIYRKHIRQETLESDLPDYFDTRERESQVTLTRVIPYTVYSSTTLSPRHLHNDKNVSSKGDACQRSTSFQNSVDFNQQVTRSWTDPNKPAVAKPTTRERLDFYNSVAVGDDPTTMAENPFQQNSLDVSSSLSDLPPPPPPHTQDFGSGLYAYHSVSEVDYPTDSKGNVIIPSPEIYARPQKKLNVEGATNTYSTDTSSVQDRMSPTDVSSETLPHYLPPPPVPANQNRFDRNLHQHPMPPANQNVFDSDIDVHGKYNSHDLPMNVRDSPRSSYSDENYNQDLTSFKVGSTTQLVGTPSKSSKSRSGSSMLSKGGSGHMMKDSGSLNLHKQGAGNISFVDTVDMSPPNSMYSSMTSQRSGIDPALGGDEDGRPGITVYY